MNQLANIPRPVALFIPTLQALKNLGGSGSIDEITSEILRMLNLSDEVLNVLHGNTSQSELAYRSGWSRTYLKKYGLIENSARGIWALTSTAINLENIDPREIVRVVKGQSVNGNSKEDFAGIDNANELVASVEHLEEIAWHQKLHNVLLSLSPDAFERLTQRLLRESGFIQVQVTGKSGDGGIDGVGIARINGFLSFHVLFQCKRYQGSVTASQIRDFRGAMQGRTDKGLVVTTGTFTRDAVKEATRDGAPPIDLIDGEQLVQRLKDLKLGVNIKMIESVEVDLDWFTKI
jgi:restriction system protein